MEKGKRKDGGNSGIIDRLILIPLVSFSTCKTAINNGIIVWGTTIQQEKSTKIAEKCSEIGHLWREKNCIERRL
ncbi:hypothetical protein X777_08297 [Ooceraea biroi]|uniref:Uncharacterized protein n=1 Tax=Ooceraea biroi TaxID=2015173 RepID=A0A026WYE9_OOCBI|nr:hypothetical protein X777_08297 [Ooceraea biroi]